MFLNLIYFYKSNDFLNKLIFIARKKNEITT